MFVREPLEEKMMTSRHITAIDDELAKILTHETLDQLIAKLAQVSPESVNFGELLRVAASMDVPCKIDRLAFFQWAFSGSTYKKYFIEQADFRRCDLVQQTRHFTLEGFSIAEQLMACYDLKTLQFFFQIASENHVSLSMKQMLGAALMFAVYREGVASFQNLNDILKYLLSGDNPYQKECLEYINVQNDIFNGQFHPLSIAAMYNNVEAMQLLYQHGAIYPKSDKFCRYTPLTIACTFGHTATLKYLNNEYHPGYEKVVEELKSFPRFECVNDKGSLLTLYQEYALLDGMVNATLDMNEMFFQKQYDNIILLIQSGAPFSFAQLNSVDNTEFAFLVLCCHSAFSQDDIALMGDLLQESDQRKLLLKKMLEFVTQEPLSVDALHCCQHFLASIGIQPDGSLSHEGALYQIFHPKQWYSFMQQKPPMDSKLMNLHQLVQAKLKNQEALAPEEKSYFTPTISV